MTLAQGLVSAGYICPTPASKPPIIVKSALVGTIDPCSVVEPPSAVVLAIDTFAAAVAGPLEIGTALLTPAFTASYTGTPTVVTLDDNQGNPADPIALPATAFSSPLSYPAGLLAPGSLSFQLDATDGVTPDSANDAIAYQARVLVGWTANPGPYTEADLLGMAQLTNVLAANEGFSRTLMPIAAYVVHAYFEDFGPRLPSEYSIGGAFPGGFTEQAGLVAMTVGGGNIVNYRVARTNLVQTSPLGTLYVGTP